MKKLWISFVFACVSFPAFSGVVYNESDARTFLLFVTLGLGAALVGFTALVCSLVARDGTGSRYARRAAGVLSPLCFMLAMAISLSNGDHFSWIWGLVWIAVGLVIYSAISSRLRTPRRDDEEVSNPTP